MTIPLASQASAASVVYSDPDSPKPNKKHPEGRPIHGLRKCYHCRGKFTVRKGTIFEDSPIELHLWFQAAHLMCSSKKGISSNQLYRVLGVTLKTAWFMSHRLREAKHRRISKDDPAQSRMFIEAATNSAAPMTRCALRSV